MKDLKKHFPVYRGFFRKAVHSVKAVDGISFAIRKGEVLGLVGESGSGKSTAARTAIRLIEPTSGSIQFAGEDLCAFSTQELRKWRKRAQMVFQDPYSSLNPRKNIAENIGEAALFHQMVRNRAERDELVAEVLKRVGLSAAVLYRYPHQFSGGQQQRICIGRAIALQPELIVCDEAVSALDVSVQGQILNLLLELKETLGLSYLFISHDLAVVRYLCDRVMVLHRGSIVEGAPVEELFASPQHAYTQELLRAIPCRHPRERKRF